VFDGWFVLKLWTFSVWREKEKIFLGVRNLHFWFTIWFGLKAVYNYIFSYIFSVLMTNFHSNCPPLSFSPVSIHKLLKKKTLKDWIKNQKLPHVTYCTILNFRNLLKREWKVLAGHNNSIIFHQLLRYTNIPNIYKSKKCAVFRIRNSKVTRVNLCTH
jgi:hypothetical protein